METYKHTNAECKEKLEGIKIMLRELSLNIDPSVRATADGATEMINQLIRELTV